MSKGFLPIVMVAVMAFAASPRGADEERSDDGKLDAALAQVAINVADLGRPEECYEIELYQPPSA